MCEPLLRTIHAASDEQSVVYLSGIIGGEATATFRRNVGRFFGSVETVQPDDGRDPPPFPRAIHRLTGRVPVPPEVLGWPPVP